MPPPLLAMPGQDDGKPQEGTLKRRRGRKRPKPDEESWETEPVRRSRKGNEKRQMGWFLAGGTLLLGLILGGVVIANKRKDGPATLAAAPAVPPAPTGIEARSDAEVGAEIAPLAATFLNANTVEAMLPVVRNPKIAGERLRDYYAKVPFTVAGLAKFNPSQTLSRSGKVVSTMVTTRDFQTKELVFVETPEGIKVDWESWVGWSGMPWEDFRAKRPETAVEFRVNLEKVAYYNFAFSDDSKWQSYRLVSPDGEQSIYGYVAKGTELESQVAPDLDAKRTSLILKLKFPPGATTDNQVVIDGFVASGWVEKEEQP